MAKINAKRLALARPKTKAATYGTKAVQPEGEASLQVFGSVAASGFGAVLKFGDTKLNITCRELDMLNAALQRHVQETGTDFAFVYSLLGDRFQTDDSRHDTFVLEYPIEGVRPADYNPRHLSDEAFERLQESVRTIGMLKPIIVTRDGLIIAGHQRTKTLLRMGIKTCPAYVIERPGKADEVIFNQFHNAADKETSFWQVRVPPRDALGWQKVLPAEIEIVSRQGNAGKFAALLRLLNKYGEWGNAVVTRSGEVIVGQLYSAGCRTLRMPLRVVVVEDAQRASVLRYFGQEYGQFSYEHLEKTTWNQSLAQPPSLGDEEDGRGRRRSYVYVDYVIPRLRKRPELRVLDFGAGKKDHVTELSRDGYRIIGIEFFHRKDGSGELDTAEVHADIDVLCRSLAQDGLFDLVVCDTVINSVDSLQAEHDVMTCISSLCRPGGEVIFSGRELSDHQASEYEADISSGNQRRVHFIDKHGFTAAYGRGVWLYQKFHTLEQARSLAARYVGDVVEIQHPRGRWAIVAAKTFGIPVDQAEESLAREFNLPYPGGRSVGRSEDIVAAYRAALIQH